MKVTLLSVALSVLFSILPVSAQAVIRHYQLDIPRQPLDAALKDFAHQTGLQVARFSDRVDGSALVGPIRGELSVEQALRSLLGPRGLSFRVVNERTIAILKPTAATDPAAAETGSSGRNTADSLEKSESRSFWDRFRLAQADPGATANDSVPVASDESPAEDSAQRDQLEQIVVTATKRLENVQDIPLSIAVISNQDIERRGLIGMEDYLRSVPGVNQIDNGPQSNAIIIRGITTSPVFENFSSGPTVATYFGESPITGAAGMGQGGIDVRPVDIERIEVLRGPQGTAYGSASLGGTLRMIPVKAGLDRFSARVSASLSDTSGNGSENSMVQGIINVPIVEGRFALRALGYRYDESGFYRNIAGTDPATIADAESWGVGDFVRGFVQDEVGQSTSTGGRFAALWRPTEQLDLSLNYLTQTIEQDGSPLTTNGGFEQTRTPIAPIGRVRGEVGSVNDTEIDLVNLVLNYNFGWATLTTAASWIDGGSVYAAPAGFLGPTSTTGPSEFRSFTGETRLASQLEGRFQFLAGLFYENVDDKFYATLDWPEAPSPFGSSATVGLSATARELDQRAVFGELSYDLTEQFTATIGGRYFKYDKDESSLLEGDLFGIALGAGVRELVRSTEDKSSLKASLEYRPTKDAMLYASWAEGFRLGRPSAGVLTGVCDADNNGVLDGTNVTVESTRRINSDFLDNYEIGAKFTLLDRRMVVDTSIYHISWDGLPIRAVPPNCNVSYTANVGAATSDGVELQASLFLVEGLRLDIGGAYTRAELAEDAPGLTPPAFDGDRLPGSPKVSANLAAQYDFDAFGHSAFVRADSFYAGRFYGDLQQTPDYSAGDYVKVDARAGIEIRQLSVELFVRNLTNEDAFTWRDNFRAHRLRPRTSGIQLTYNFE